MPVIALIQFRTTVRVTVTVSTYSVLYRLVGRLGFRSKG